MAAASQARFFPATVFLQKQVRAFPTCLLQLKIAHTGPASQARTVQDQLQYIAMSSLEPNRYSITSGLSGVPKSLSLQLP